MIKMFWRLNLCPTYHQQICSPNTVGFLFILMMVSLAVQKLFNLMYPCFFIFSFVLLALGEILEKLMLCKISEILLRMFSFRILYGIELIFTSFIHFEFILVCSIIWCPSFFFFFFFFSHEPLQFSQHHLLKGLSLLHCMLLLPLSKIN